MKFDFCIGNPPYQDNTIGDNEGYAPPVYNKFLDSASDIADKVEMIHPARFLFNAGSTPKSWNEKMLNDEHFKVLHYEENAVNVFPNTDIKGGIAITYLDKLKTFNAIKVFTKFPELTMIANKVSKMFSESLSEIIYTQNRFNLNNLYIDRPDLKKVIGSNGSDRRFRNNIFDKVNVFLETGNDNDFYKTIGVIKNKRVWRYILKKYVDETGNLKKWKVMVSRANGAGKFGEVVTLPFVLRPFEAYTQTFIGVGSFDTEVEAKNCIKYIKSKFLRTLLGALKVTQDNDREVWRLIPVQDFTDNSDIDWSKSVKEIDQQLYKKYKLTDEEINFIETKVKEMA